MQYNVLSIEIAQHYFDRNSPVYSVFLDATYKAFDRVYYGKLFRLLIERNVPSIIIRMYVNQTASVHWNGSRSDNFSLHNGVKQGGNLSPVLFTVYFDTLLVLLKESKIGCRINNSYAGALAYADDVTLLCPSLYGLNRMLEICDKFAQTFDVTFNPKKSVAMCMGERQSVEGFVYMNGQKIVWKDEVKHLGSIVTNACVDDSDCKYKSSCFIGSVNKLLASFGNMRTRVKNRLFQSYCASFYGSQMWRLSCKYLSRLYVYWNTAVKKLHKLPFRTHRWTLGPIMNVPQVQHQLESMIRIQNPALYTFIHVESKSSREGHFCCGLT